MPDNEQHLFETEETGPLDTRGYPVGNASDSGSSASLSGPVSGLRGPQAVKGIGGSVSSYKVPPKPMVEHTQSPEELMALANQLQAQMADNHEAMMANGAALREGHPQPEWLKSYMAGQDRENPTDPYHTQEESRASKINSNKYLTDSEKRSYNKKQ